MSACLERIRPVLRLAALLTLAGGAALAQDCGCNPLPAEGIYGKAEPVTLSHVGGRAEACPTQLRLRAKRVDAPDMNVILTEWLGANCE
ncbi:hypothetical protein [Roseovarius aquimarinus]|uniref:Lipoprotein n=1 Tax=Roseovarius aquimarinus TaxID=1229156 RepID=A0ABW7I2U2_9RHOB